MQSFLSEIKPSKRGPKPAATYKDIVHFLCAIFVEDTGKKAQREKIEDNYEGEAYHFVIMLKPRLNDAFFSNLLQHF